MMKKTTAGIDDGVDSGAREIEPFARGFSVENRNRLVRLAYRFLWNREEAEDAVQDAMTTAIVRRNELKEVCKWWTWLVRILINRCHESRRRGKRRQQHETAAANEESREAHSVAGSDRDRSKQMVARLLPLLPRRQREVLVLRHLEALPYERIAELLNMSESTARVHARQGLEKLASLMETKNPGWAGEIAGE